MDIERRWTRPSATEAEQRIELTRSIEGEEFVASANAPAVDEYLRDGMPPAGALHHFDASPGSQADIEFQKLDPFMP